MFANRGAAETAKEGDTAPVQVATGDTPSGREEPMRPSPEDLKMPEPEAAHAETEGRLAFGPAVTVTPLREYVPPAPKDGEEPAAKDAPEKGTAPKEKTGDAALKPYTVVKGDTFPAIARKVYGPDGEKQWRRVYEANKKTVKDPNRLCIGQVLAIPAFVPAPAPAPTPGKTTPAVKSDTDTVAKTPSAAPVKAPAKSAADLAAGTTGDASAKAVVEPAPRVTPLKSVLSKASRDGIPELTADEIGRMYGSKSDLVESPAMAPRVYTVQPGDTFSRIGSRLYGDAKTGKLLLLKNQHLVSDETKLKIGQKILLLDGVDTNRMM